MENMSQTIGSLAKALAAAQSELNPASKNASNPMLRNKYADLSSCISACREVLPKHGLSYSQVIAQSEKDTVTVVTVLMHESGEWIQSSCSLPCIGNKGVNGAQAAGSAITYARRYGLSAIVGLATDDDDDGCKAGPTGAEQHRQVQQSAKAANPNGLTDQQRKALFARLNEICPDKSQQREVCAQMIGHDFQTAYELTQEDFKKFMSEADRPADSPF